MKAFLKSIVVHILIAEARFLLKRKTPKIIAITGSVGKTSTKDAVYAAIKNNIYARKSEKSFNSDIGVPLTVLGLPNAWNNPLLWARNIVDGFFTALFSRSYPEVLVLETGIDRPGDMERLTRWIRPDIVVLTRLPAVPVHVEYFSSPEAVIEEKMKLVSALKPDGVLIYNNDDTLITGRLSEVMQRKVGFGRYLKTDFTAKNDEIVYADDIPGGVRFQVEHQDQNHVIEIQQTVGTPHTYACSAALAVADELSVPLTEASAALHILQALPGRMRILPGIKSTILIDDTYNSSPIAVESALQTLHEIKHATRKIAVLGDMLELGKFSSDEHRKIGEQVFKVADVLFTVGVRAKQIAEGALVAGMSEKHIFHTSS